jgi:hypothetical protein
VLREKSSLLAAAVLLNMSAVACSTLLGYWNAVVTAFRR